MPALVCPARDVVRWYVVHGVNRAVAREVGAGAVLAVCCGGADAWGRDAAGDADEHAAASRHERGTTIEHSRRIRSVWRTGEPAYR
jgi:hypothetical protein